MRNRTGEVQYANAANVIVLQGSVFYPVAARRAACTAELEACVGD